MGISAGLDFSAQIGIMGQKLDAIAKAIKDQQVNRSHPAQAQNVLSPIATFSSYSQLTSLGGPTGGMAWEVERISFGQTPGAPAISTQGTLIVYLGNTEIARTSTVPNTLFFRGLQCYVIPSQDLFAVWVGGVTTPAGGGLLVDVSALEYPILLPYEAPET